MFKCVFGVILRVGRKRCVENSKPNAVTEHMTKGLVIGPMIWREMRNFSQDCVLIVIANENYDESGYVRDYKDFKNMF